MHGRSRTARAATAPKHSGVEVIRVGPVDDESGDRDRLEEVARDMRPGLAAIGGLEDPVTEVAVAGERALAGAGVHDGVVGRRDRERPDREGGKVVGPRRPLARRGVVQPDATLRGAEDELAVALADGESADSATHRAEGLTARAAQTLNDGVRAEVRPWRCER